MKRGGWLLRQTIALIQLLCSPWHIYCMSRQCLCPCLRGIGHSISGTGPTRYRSADPTAYLPCLFASLLWLAESHIRLWNAMLTYFSRTSKAHSIGCLKDKPTAQFLTCSSRMRELCTQPSQNAEKRDKSGSASIELRATLHSN